MSSVKINKIWLKLKTYWQPKTFQAVGAWLILTLKDVDAVAIKATVLIMEQLQVDLQVITPIILSQTVLTQIMFCLMENHMSSSNTLSSTKSILNFILALHLSMHRLLWIQNSLTNISDTPKLILVVSMEVHSTFKEPARTQSPRISLNGRITNK